MTLRRVIIVEDSPMVLKVIKHVMTANENFIPIYADTYKGAQSLLAQHQDIFAAVVDLTLPDAANGEVVDLVLQRNLPTIVLTATFDNQRREALLSKGITDYVVKEGKYSYMHVSKVLDRLVKNQRITVLVVDDSSVSRKQINSMLRAHLYQVLEAENGVAAIKTILEHPEVKLLITDYNMPHMDGFELVKNLRAKYEKSELVIIGVSSKEDAALSAKFIKIGASDFLKKPYNHEEFYCRLTHNVEMLELVERIRDMAFRDELTGVYNRKYFFEQGAQLHQNALMQGGNLAVAIIEFDHFHQITEAVGMESSDQVVVYFARFLAEAFQRFMFARVGMYEFFVLMPGLSNAQALAFVDEVRQLVVKQSVRVAEQVVGISISAGVSNCRGNSLDEMLSMAMLSLNRAKEAGGDLIMGDDE